MAATSPWSPTASRRKRSPHRNACPTGWRERLMRALPLFHVIAGRPVVVLGDGAAAEAKRRLVERARGLPITELANGIECGARLAFVAHDDPVLCEADAAPLRAAGLLVNVVDRPELCDFTVPSLLERDPLLVAVGTAGQSAGLAKH